MKFEVFFIDNFYNKIGVTMKKILLLNFVFLLAAIGLFANPVSIKVNTPKAGDSYRTGRTVSITWDTLDNQGNRTFNSTFVFKWAEAQDGPWNLLAVGANLKEFTDASGNSAVGKVSTVLPRKSTLYIKMQLKADTTVNQIVGPITVLMPAPASADSIITGDITGPLYLSSQKLYQLSKVVFIQNGGVLTIQPGTVIMGDPNDVSALCVNRGGKIYAIGTPTKPIIFTSGYAAGSRDRGDWGGVLLMGCATTNLTEAAIEGGIADDQTSKKNGWYGNWNGVSNDNDNSGTIKYARIEFAGIAASPDNELNGLTFGAVGNGTTIENVQVSYGGDDSFEWFGGSVNCKHLVAFNGIDDDFDTDNGFHGKVQFGFGYRLPAIADQSNSEAFESDNDSKASENKPFTEPVFCNMTTIGGVRDTSWTAGAGDNKYNPKYLTAVQIRRNSRLSLFNSLIVGWPAGVEMTNQNTVRAANADSLMVRNNSFIGIKNNKFFYFGSGTTAAGTVDANWLSNSLYNNEFINGNGSVGDLAQLTNAFPVNLNEMSPVPKSTANYNTTANFNYPKLQDSFFDQVNYRGAFSPDITKRWDLPWSEYDPVNKVYTKTSVEDQNQNDYKLDITVSPNPTSDVAKIIYQIPNDETVSIRIFNSVGNLVQNIADNVLQSQGFYEFSINTTNLSTGMYFIQVVTNDGSATQKISVVR